jgi:eukaryotic-like serine/threonine-protein kinase
VGRAAPLLSAAARGRYRGRVLSQGVVLNDRYLLNNRVATGGMGEVWSAVDTLLNRMVAVKVLLPALISDTEFITRFRTEARLMAALRHPGIVQVYDYGENALVDGDRVDYLVMAYIEGVSLARRIEAAGRLSVAETLSVVAQAAQALHVAHQANIVHRDVKPSNLLVQPDGAVVLVDFGVARSATITGVTASNVVLGTTHYMSPEQISGERVSAASDIYALGAVTYCCLTGRPPFTGTNPLYVVSQHLQDAPPALPADIPAPVADLVTRALAKQPGDRYPSAAAFAQAARAAQAAAGDVPVPGPRGTAESPTVDLSEYAAPGQPPRLPGQQPAGVPHAAPGHRPDAPRALSGEPRPDTGPAGGGNRRRAGIVAGVAGVLVVALVGLVAFLALRPEDESKSPAGQQAQAGGETSASAAPEVDEVEPAAKATDDPTASARTPAGPPPSPTTTSRPAASATPGNPRPSTTPPTSPATNPYTPTQVCGSGYQVIDSATLKGSDGALRGRVYLLYKTSSGDNCVVTMKTASVGSKTAVSAYLEVQGRTRSTDSGSFAYYAGPVRATAAGVCVKWGGSAGGASYGSPFEHCG